MATIQVRDIPESAYEIIHRRARAAGKSLQAYMLEQVLAMAARPTDDELFAATDERLRSSGPRVDVDDLLADLRDDRR